MLGIIAWIIICLGLSGWEYQSVAGDITLIKWSKGVQPYNDWSNQVCAIAPYNFLSPFSFTFQQTNASTSTSSNGVVTKVPSKTVILNTTTKTKCGWPSQNSSLRLTICVFSLLTVVALFFRTRLSLFAQSVAGMWSFMFMVSFVLDANATYVGLTACQGLFLNTKFGDNLSAAGVIPACDLSDYSGLTFIDFLISFLFGLFGAAWGMCKEPYSKGGETNLDTSRSKNISMDDSASSYDSPEQTRDAESA